MRVLLAAAGLIAAAAVSTPATAQSGAAAGFSGVTVQQSGGFAGSPSFRDGNRHDRRRHRGFDGASYVDREYQGDTAWRSESFNDWWHSRPERSYPAWMTRNQKCERQWWSGNILRC